MSKVIRAWDTETTTGADWAGRKASPWLDTNYVVAQAWADFSDSGFMAGGRKVPMTPVTSRYYTQAPADGWFSEVLEGCDILCGANIKFDLHHALYNKPLNKAAYREWVKRGGRIWDILQVEYLLGYMLDGVQFLSLEEVASRYGGNTKLDQVKAMWASGIDTPDISRNILMQYLCGVYDDEICEHGDIGNTMVAALGQMQEVRARKMEKWVKVEMLALQATTEIEMNGLKMDWDRAEECRARALEKVKEATAVVMDAVDPEIRGDISLTSIWDKSLVLYGGQKKIERKGYLNTEGEILDVPWPVGQAYAKKEEVVPVLDEDGNPVIYKSGKNVGLPKTKKVKVDDLERPKTKLYDRYVTMPRRIDPLEGTESAKPGFWSVSGDVLDDLSSDDPVVQAVKDAGTWLKDIGTSYYSLDENGNKVKGLYAHLGPDGIIHPSYHHNRTATARLASSSPNSQNLSKVGEVKTCFISRYPGGKIAQADYTSLELYVGYWLSDCSGYKKLLGEGKDLHCFTAAAWRKMPYDELYAKYEAGDKVIKGWRQASKAVNFGLAFGAGAAKMAQTTKLPKEDVEALISANHQSFPGYEKFQQKVYDHLTGHVVITGETMRHPDDPTKASRKGYATWRSQYGLAWGYPLQPTPSFVLWDTGATESISPTQARNYHVQGTGGSVMKCSLAVQFLVLTFNPKLDKIKMVGTVHDAAYWDCPGDIADKAGALLQATMTAANEVLTNCGQEIKIPVPAVTTVGDSWKEADGDLKVDAHGDDVVKFEQYIHKTIVEKVFV